VFAGCRCGIFGPRSCIASSWQDKCNDHASTRYALGRRRIKNPATPPGAAGSVLLTRRCRRAGNTPASAARFALLLHSLAAFLVRREVCVVKLLLGFDGLAAHRGLHVVVGSHLQFRKRDRDALLSYTQESSGFDHRYAFL